MLFCFLRLYWVFIKSECLDVGSGKYLSAVNQPAIILIFKNIAFFRNCLLCLFWASFWLRDFGLFFLIVWCNFVLVIYWTVVLYEKEEKLWSDGALLVSVVKPYVKMSALWFKIQAVDLLIWACIVCCENVFLFWTSFCERRKLNRFSNSDGYCSCVEENAAGCLALF